MKPLVLWCVLSTLLFSLFVEANPQVDQVEYTDGTRETIPKKFPKEFLFGASSAAFQVEGAWNRDGKGPSIWDEFTHSSSRIADHSNADVGPDSYEFYEKDIRSARIVGLHFYRFSISWSRILPDGDIANINEAGIEYYDKVINKTIEYGLTPMVTIYHFDLPLELQKIGGWANPLIIRYYKAYANLLFERFGDRVLYWITFNEPLTFCVQGYGKDISAPGIDAHGVGEYLCGHSVLKAHSVAYRLYKETFYSRFKGQVGITLNSAFFYSRTNDTKDVDRALQFNLGWFAHPIFSSRGNYPPVMISQIANNSKQEKRLWSRLPDLSSETVNMLKGSADFLGLNYYTSRFVQTVNTTEGRNPSFYRDQMLKTFASSAWARAKSSWLYSVPSGLSDILRWIKQEYNNPPVIITENGWSDNGEINDTARITYFREHLKQLLDALLNDECNVKGYSVSSLIDGFEWTRGYTEKFGLFAVNVTSPQKDRIPKLSASYIDRLIDTRQVPESNWNEKVAAENAGENSQENIPSNVIY